MAFKTTRRVAGGVAGSALLALGAATAAGGAAAAQPQIADADPSSTTHVVNDREVLAHWIDVDDASVRLANVEGSFSFNQEGTTPNDELFNVFGTALTSMCSKPAVELADAEGGVANFYVNVGGNVKKTFTVTCATLPKTRARRRRWRARAPPACPSARRPSWAFRCRLSWRWPTSRTA